MKQMNEYAAIVNQALEMQVRSLGDIPDELMKAMLYSLNAGGKRLRPAMLLAACDMAGGRTDLALPFACALEMIHTYSLIHDDLPGMDNDDLRRGLPTSHKVFGEGMAILAGDGLLNGAMELMMKTSLRMGDLRGFRASESIIRHAGITGMIAGQAWDLMLEKKDPTEDGLRTIDVLKTSELLQASMEAGLILAGCNPEVIEKGRQYGLHLGIAFQITDDLLDVVGDVTVIGKNTHVDSGIGKMTWIALRGIEGSRREAEKETELAAAAIHDIGFDASFFEELARKTVGRVK